MAVWQLLIIYENIPIVLWGFAWYYENSYSKFPDTSKGFKIKCAKKDEEIWVYANKIAGKIFNITAIALFIFIAIALVMLPISFI
ncbi:SdpI family protein, partial [Clostridium saudiense]|nr:SdpI family protein [Clostridium saudiense]